MNELREFEHFDKPFALGVKEWPFLSEILVDTFIDFKIGSFIGITEALENDSYEQIQIYERDYHYKRTEVKVAKSTATSIWLASVRLDISICWIMHAVELWRLLSHRIVHDCIPGLSSWDAHQSQESSSKCLEVSMSVQVTLEWDSCK